MKTSCLTQQLAFAALMIVIALSGGNNAVASGGGSWGGSWGGSYGSGGSWGGSGGFRTPVRDFFAYRQPVRNVFRGVAAGFRAGFGSRGYGSWGGSGGYSSFGNASYGSTGSYASYSGGYASGGYNYYGSSYPAPAVMSATPTMAVQPMVQPGVASPGTIPYSDSTYYGDSTILDSGSIINADPYYSEGATGTTDNGSVIDDTNVRGFETPPSPEPANGGDAGGDTTMLRGDAILNVSVPRDAQVYVNGRLTKTGGTSRSYVSRKLKSNRNYQFHVRAEIERDGETVSLDQQVSLRGGVSRSLDFDFDKPILTQLTVKVPENAKVKLSGNETSAKGKLRNFKTKLVPGKSWQDYKVEVSMDVDGETVTQQRLVTIKAGGKYVVDFESDNDFYVSK